MSHVVPAARQLLREIGDIGGKAEALDERDGIGFQRSIRMTRATAEKLGDVVLEALESDSRITEVVKSPKGVRVTFTTSAVRSGDARPFGLASVV